MIKMNNNFENLGFVKTKEGILKKILWNKEKKQICEIKIF